MKSTSKAAWRSVKDNLSETKEKIIKGIIRLKIGGNYEEIARKSNLEPVQVARRMSELERDQIVFPAGIRKTSTGRAATVWQLFKKFRKKVA